jgi:hypothetical protein
MNTNFPNNRRLKICNRQNYMPIVLTGICWYSPSPPPPTWVVKSVNGVVIHNAESRSRLCPATVR